MTEPILFVDDDVNLVSALQRNLRKDYGIAIATSASDALEAVRDDAYALVVSDLQMPGMNGIELLTRIKDFSPETVRILLTGRADLEAAIDAVNEGCIFRFLRKPCPQGLLTKTLDAGLAQYRPTGRAPGDTRGHRGGIGGYPKRDPAGRFRPRGSPSVVHAKARGGIESPRSVAI